MSNKTDIFTDKDLSNLTQLFNEIKKSENTAAIKLKDNAATHYVLNGCNLNRPEDFLAECWTMAILIKLNTLGYEIRKKGQ